MWRSKTTWRRRAAWLGACLAVLLVAATPAGSAPPPDRDPAVQAQMQRVVEAVVGSTGDAAVRIERLAGLSPSRDALLVQIALFLRDAGGTEQAMTGALVLQHLRFTDDEKIAALVPLLETDDAGLRHVLYDLLGTVDRPDGGEPEFAPYLPLLGGDSPPPGLVRYIYDVSPAAALQAMTSANPGAPFPSNDRDVEAVDGVLQRRAHGAALDPSELRRAAGSVERLSLSPVWWVRLYAASVIREEPALAADDVRGRLAGDDNPIVRAAARDRGDSPGLP